MSDQSPSPGWYPAPHANNEQRYWDGAHWLELATAPAAPPKAPRGLAIASLVVGIVAFLAGLVPVLGVILGIAAATIGIIALVKKQPRGLSITGVALGAVAVIASIAMTIGLITVAANSSRPAASNTNRASSTPAPTAEATEVPSEEPEEVAPPAPSAPDLATFAPTDDRTWALIAKDPDAHAGTNLILYGTITQFDSATGRCAMLISTAATQQEMSFDYEQSVMAVSGDWDAVCPTFDPLVEDDHVQIWATVKQSFSYDTQIGGNTTVPMVEVWQAQLLPATEY